MDDTIGTWTPAELRRFIQGELHNDPTGMLPGVTQLADQLSKLGLTGHTIAFGSLTLTFTANAFSATVTTPHGLGAIPRVWTQPADFGVLATGPLIYVGNIDAASFDCKAQDAGGVARTGSIPVYWLAIA